MASLIFFSGLEGDWLLWQSNRADGDQVFYAYTGIVKFFRYIYNQTQVMFNKKLFSFFILPASEKGNGMTFFFTAKWERQDICPSYVMVSCFSGKKTLRKDGIIFNLKQSETATFIIIIILLTIFRMQ